jgi:chemotaxis protein methyltransferase CheR
MPRLGLEPNAYARVRGQVCKRLTRRLAELRLGDLDDYASYLSQQPEEWSKLDGLCRVTISRFFRDRVVFDALAGEVLPRLARRAAGTLRVWSAGCAAGEEPYSLALIWRHVLAPRFSDVALEIVATDADPHQLERARAALYRPSSFRELPPGVPPNVDADLVRSVTFLQQDLRREAPDGPFALVVCRNVAFSYFDETRKCNALHIIAERLVPGGALVIGLREKLPRNSEFSALGGCLFEKRVSAVPD